MKKYERGLLKQKAGSSKELNREVKNIPQQKHKQPTAEDQEMRLSKIHLLQKVGSFKEQNRGVKNHPQQKYNQLTDEGQKN